MPRSPLLAALLVCAPVASADPGAKPPEKVDYTRDVKPILSRYCFACHGADEDTRAAGLRLDDRESATKPRKKGAVVAPGQPGASRLVARILSADEDDRMPPPETKNVVSPEEAAVLKRWIAQGADYAKHWAFVAPVRSAVPEIRNPQSAIRNPIDAFVLARLEKEGLKPSPEADRFVLLRRASLDIRGLPPSAAEVAAFAKDTSPGAYEKMVDRFLTDPAYGERWARIWLDLARYADSAGYGSDPLRTNMWPYRDWVIRALNANTPYDRFTVEQLAGDLLPNATTDQKVATAFHRNTMTNTEGGTIDEEWRVAAVKDRTATTLQVWMGLTMGCAQCHNHKYDPLSQKDFYRTFAVFNQTADNDQPNEAPTLPVPSPDHEKAVREYEAKLAALKAKFNAGPQPKAVSDEVAKLEKARPQPLSVPVMAELAADKRRKSFVMLKGNYLSPGEAVTPAVPGSFHPLPKGADPDRLGLAKWLVSRDNPLTARVAVNRVWAQLFGLGLVETEEDFGTQGELPSHPELLDWLAVEFMEPSKPSKPTHGRAWAFQGSTSSWDMKYLLKLVVTSGTYRQSSRVTPDVLAKDPQNRLLARGPRHRLEAEMVRDQALAISGLLSKKVGGPSVYPPQPDGLWQAAFNGQRTWATSAGEDRYRRGLYTFWRRTVPYPSMAAFDAPSRETCQIRRIRSNTPVQAFVTLNDPVYVEAAQALARRVIADGGKTPEDRARFALQLALARPPADAQVQPLVKLYRAEKETFAAKPAEAAKLATQPLGPLPAGVAADEAAAWTVVANVLLNLDGVLMKE